MQCASRRWPLALELYRQFSFKPVIPIQSNQSSPNQSIQSNHSNQVLTRPFKHKLGFPARDILGACGVWIGVWHISEVKNKNTIQTQGTGTQHRPNTPQTQHTGPTDPTTHWTRHSPYTTGPAPTTRYQYTGPQPGTTTLDPTRTLHQHWTTARYQSTLHHRPNTSQHTGPMLLTTCRI